MLDKSLTYSEACWTVLKKSLSFSTGLLVTRLVVIISMVFIGRLQNPDFIVGFGMGELT